MCVVGYSIPISHYIPLLSPPTPNETPLNLHYYSKKLWSKWVWVLFNHFPIADFGLKNQILAWTNDARFVFEQNCNHSRHWTVVDRNPTQKGLKLFTFQSSLREIRGNWHILLSRLGVRDPARKVMLECDCTSKHLRRKKMQPPKPKSKIYLEITVSHSFCTKNVQAVLMAQHSRKDCGHLRDFLSNHLFCHVFPVSQWWETLQTSHLECLPKNWNVFRRKRNE